MGSLSQTYIVHIIRLGLILLVVALLGWWLGATQAFVLVALLIYLAWNLSQTRQLALWLDGQRPDGLESQGIWDKFFARLDAKFEKKNLTINKLQSQYQDLIEASNAFPDALVFVDTYLNLERFNPLATKNLGLQESDIGLPINNLIRVPEFSHWLESQGIGTHVLEINSPTNESQRLQIQYVAYTKTQILLVFKDVTRSSMQDKIRQDFVANVSHELRTPLTVLSGYLEILSADSEDPHHEIFLKLQRQSSAMTALVSDLLELASLQNQPLEAATSKKLIDVPLILDKLGQTAVELSADRHTISCQIERELKIPGEQRDLESALGNLIANAVRYAGNGGEIQIRWYSQGDKAIYEVIDNGPGISKQDLPRLTERFYRADAGRNRHHGGTGLGLAIVKHIVEKHHARLEIESEIDSGSTFRIIFPK